MNLLRMLMGRNNPKRQRKSKAQIIQYLRDKGIPPGLILREQNKEVKEMLLGIMGVSELEYTAALK